jgi:hypothetical protein
MSFSLQIEDFQQRAAGELQYQDLFSDPSVFISKFDGFNKG